MVRLNIIWFFLHDILKDLSFNQIFKWRANGDPYQHGQDWGGEREGRVVWKKKPKTRVLDTSSKSSMPYFAELSPSAVVRVTFKCRGNVARVTARPLDVTALATHFCIFLVVPTSALHLTKRAWMNFRTVWTSVSHLISKYSCATRKFRLHKG